MSPIILLVIIIIVFSKISDASKNGKKRNRRETPKFDENEAFNVDVEKIFKNKSQKMESKELLKNFIDMIEMQREQIELGEVISNSNEKKKVNNGKVTKKLLDEDLKGEDMTPIDLTKDKKTYGKDFKGSLNEKKEDYKTIEEEFCLFEDASVDEAAEENKRKLREALILKEILDKPVSMRDWGLSFFMDNLS